ncbi:unnamed protein product [Oppiella nova]|uniref:NR LBD domain-containing protein n=1 Tax=Oppiella nova TaxID=334625 RepID=A0A7R9MN62_9ACAR|nr:unnamed protein product [Oppiella nova]CAG2180470.1 unnamed protein product [Oppiella nova]
MISHECIQIKDQELGTASHDTLYGELAIRSQEIQIRNIIKMSKRLNAFKSLCEQDKMILIKYASFEIITLRTVLNFNFQDMYWTANINTGKQDITCKVHLFGGRKCALADLNPNNINHQTFLESMGTEWDSEVLIIDLLTAIILFNPNRPNLVNKNTINSLPLLKEICTR